MAASQIDIFTPWVFLVSLPSMLHSHPPSHRPLLAVPHPVRATRTTLRRLHRYLRVLRIAARRGLAPYLGLRGDPKSAAAAAASTRMAMEDAGGMFVKLGQLLAGRADLVPTEGRREFARLHESATPADPAAVLSMLEAELNAPPTEIFASLDTTPVRCPSGGVA